VKHLDPRRYIIKLFKEGAWRRVAVNDELPVGPRKDLAYVRSVNNDELWPSLLEKAYAKVSAHARF